MIDDLLQWLRLYFDSPGQLSSPPPPADWARMIALASEHGVLLLLDRAISRVPDCAAPASARAQARAIALRSLRRTRELLQLQELFSRHGIEIIPYKGPVLALEYYGGAGLRTFTDLDFLVRPGQVFAARDLLLQRGYRTNVAVHRAQEPALLASRNEIPLYRDEGGLIELQWRVVPDYFSSPLDYEGIWARARSLRIGTHELRTLSPEDLILILCIHGSKHRWSRLRWVADVAAFLSRAHDAVDWAAALAAASRAGSTRMLLLGLRLAQRCLGASLPPALEARMKTDRTVERLADEVCASWSDAGGSATSMLAEAGFHLRARERLRDRVRYCWKLAVSPTVEDWQALPLARPLPGTYHLVRPFRLAAKHLFRVGHHS